MKMNCYIVLFAAVTVTACGDPDTSGLFGGDGPTGSTGSTGSTVGSGGSTSTVSVTVTTTSAGGSVSSTATTSSGQGGMCEPQSCLDQGKDCGVIDNACGHKEDCGECSGDYIVCGDAPGMPGGGAANVCGGGCSDNGFNSGNGICPFDPVYVIDLFSCNVPGMTAPMANCEALDGAMPTAQWCCKVKAK